MDGFPYAPRPGQAELVAAIDQAQRDGGHLVVEAATGTGKTICALQASRGGSRRLVYATRTNSQQSQILREHQHMGGLMIPFMGRRHHCPLLRDDDRFKEGTPEELGRLCRHAKQKATEAHATGQAVKGACPYYQRLLEDGTAPVEALLRAGCDDTGTLAARVTDAGSCPYEAYKALLPHADTVAVPYVYLLDERLRRALLEWMGTTPGQCHVLIDEAHNLPEATRQHHSPSLGLGTLERALKEAELVDDPVLGGKVLATSFLASFHIILRDLVEEYAADQEDGWMPRDALQEALMVKFGVHTGTLAKIAADLEQWGESIREGKRKQGRLPRSYLGAVGSFLWMWLRLEDLPYVHLAIRDDRPKLEAYLLDPGARLDWLQEFASSTHMSGTLHPVAGYRDTCQLPADTSCLRLDSPFDANNLHIRGLHGVRQSYAAVQEDPQLVGKQQDMARKLIQGWGGRIGIWFPSHRILSEYTEEGFLHGVDATIYQEAPGMTTAELVALVERFRRDTSPRAVLLGVLGGRLTEGIDYPGDALEKLLILGIPYPKPSARSQALIHHHNKTGDGWRLAVHDPVGRNLRQAIGRLIRGPHDQGVAIVLDDRIVRFTDHLPDLGMARTISEVRKPLPRAGSFQSADALISPP